MRTEGFKGVLLSTLVIVSLMAPAVTIVLTLTTGQVSAEPGPSDNIVRAKETAYNVDQTNDPPWLWYAENDHPPIIVAKENIGLGKVVAGGIANTVRNGFWNDNTPPSINSDNHLDILLDEIFKWMVPGATNVLWYEGYNVYSNTTRCSDLIAALTAKGYQIGTDDMAFENIDNLTSYDILVVPQLQLGTPGTGGDPDLLPDVDVAAIKSFVEGGKGLLIADGSDFYIHQYYKVQNKILEELDFGMYFQNDQVIDPVNNYGDDWQNIVDVDNTTPIGSAYQATTGKTTIGLPSVCSLAEVSNYAVSVTISPGYIEGLPGGTLKYTVKVTNISALDDNYALTATDNSGWGLTLSENLLENVQTGESRIVTLNVIVPENALLGTDDNITVTATSLGSPEVSDSMACTASVPMIFSKMDKVKISNPYRNYSYWFKGNLHSHTENSDGANTAAEMVEAYRSKGYSFNAITDHNYITDSEAFTNLPNFLGINGEEDTVPSLHIVALDIISPINGNQSVSKRVMDILSQGGIALVAHPGWSWPLENVRQAVDARAKLMEIHGNTMEDIQISMEYWDTLLTEGRLVYGVMDDDAHSTQATSRWGWNMVNAMSLSKSNILESLRDGNFYSVQGSPPGLDVGPEIYSITVENENVVSISSSGDYVVYVSDNGVILDSKNLIDGTASSSITLGVSYIRMEVYGDNGGVSYTQPMPVSSVKFNLVTIDKISLNVNLWLENGSKVVTKFYGYDNVYQGESVFENFTPSARIVKFENVSHPENEPIEKVVLQVTGENTENVISTVASFTVPQTEWAGWAAFELENLYAVRLEKNLYLENGSKLVVKFYTYGDAFENENVIENFFPPWLVEENEIVSHPQGRPVEKAKLDLTTDDTGDVISTIASFTVRKVHLEARFTDIPLEWALASPAEKVALEIEFSEIPLYWALAPS